VDRVLLAALQDGAALVAERDHARRREGVDLRGAPAAAAGDQCRGGHRGQAQAAFELLGDDSMHDDQLRDEKTQSVKAAAARLSRSRTPSQAGSRGGASTQISRAPAASSARSTANNSWAAAAGSAGRACQRQAGNWAREYTATPSSPPLAA